MSGPNKSSKKSVPARRARRSPEGAIDPAKCYPRATIMQILGCDDPGWLKLVDRIKRQKKTLGWWSGTWWVLGEWVIRAILDEGSGDAGVSGGPRVPRPPVRPKRGATGDRGEV